MALILNIETSSIVCSVSLAKNGKILGLKETSEEKSHASLLTIYVDDLLKENNFKITDLDAVAVSEGPGSYTGLRIGVSTAKGICFGIEKPLIAVPTLYCLANSVLNTIKVTANSLLCPMIDARRMEIYTAFYNSKAERVSEIKPLIIDENSFVEEIKNHEIIVFGTGAEKCKTVFKNNVQFIDNVLPSATFMCEISEKYFNKNEFVDVAYFEPFYLKEFMVTTSKKENLF